jgi:NADPH:quinone reductase-like Zn-dependent oxidoreductase
VRAQSPRSLGQARAARFFFDGQLEPVVDRTFPLAAAAQRRLGASEQFGKIVVEV